MWIVLLPALAYAYYRWKKPTATMSGDAPTPELLASLRRWHQNEHRLQNASKAARVNGDPWKGYSR